MSDMIKLPSGSEKSFTYGNTKYVNRGPEVTSSGKRTGMYIYTKATKSELFAFDLGLGTFSCSWTSKGSSAPAAAPAAPVTGVTYDGEGNITG